MKRSKDAQRCLFDIFKTWFDVSEGSISGAEYTSCLFKFYMMGDKLLLKRDSQSRSFRGQVPSRAVNHGRAGVACLITPVPPSPTVCSSWSPHPPLLLQNRQKSVSCFRFGPGRWDHFGSALKTPVGFRLLLSGTGRLTNTCRRSPVVAMMSPRR